MHLTLKYALSQRQLSDFEEMADSARVYSRSTPETLDVRTLRLMFDYVRGQTLLGSAEDMRNCWRRMKYDLEDFAFATGLGKSVIYIDARMQGRSWA